MFIEHVTSNENNIKFALRFDRVPIRESSTSSPAYIQGDAGRALQAQEMKKRRFSSRPPGARSARPRGRGDALHERPEVAPGLAQGQRAQQQQVLDKYLAKAATLKP